MQNLERHGTVNVVLMRQVDRSHAPLVDEFDDSVGPEVGALQGGGIDRDLWTGQIEYRGMGVFQERYF